MEQGTRWLVLADMLISFTLPMAGVRPFSCSTKISTLLMDWSVVATFGIEQM